MTKRQTLLLDANLIVLLVIGLADENAVPVHKRTRAYTTGDFRLLLSVISQYRELAALPNALSEASNLLEFEGNGLPEKITRRFLQFIATTREIYVPSLDASVRNEFRRLGLTDSATLEAAKQDVHILSADLALYLAAVNAGYSAANFTHAIEAARS
ncbi:MAG: hypothetical protein PS018_19590 [bacterium]|nr:hypothetical protein [bacterium]